MTTANHGWVPLVSVVDFNHARGPEIEAWFGADDSADPAADFDWPNIPFMALADGAHLAVEDFSYFTLLKPATPTTEATTLFGISCTRQLPASKLIDKPADVTRSTVQKAVVVIADSPHLFGMLRERLSVVTSAWFAQRDFTETEILKRFQESLTEEAERGRLEEEKEREDRDQYLGMSLRQLIREFKWQTLVLFKCCLLQPKMLFFGTRCERLCMMQFSLVSLIPGLIRKLQDCADPALDSYERNLSKPTSLKTSDRNSLLSYMGLPLQIFGKGSLFGPYTPLQQLDKLADFGTKSYIVGSTNSLLLQQKDRYSDILINLDEGTINISSISLRSALNLSTADRRWIDFITQSVNDTWDSNNPERPSTMGYVGSEEFIRLQFEEYLLSLISSVKCHNYMLTNANNPSAHLPQVEGDPSADFGAEWIEAWTRTENYRLWDSNTDSHLFDIVEPKHPCAGGLTIDDVQRRLAQQVKELGLDERFAVGKEVIGRGLGNAKDRASVVFNRLYADVEALREQQRQKAAADAEAAKAVGVSPIGATSTTFKAPDLARAQTAAATVGTKASSYIGSWASWAGEKKKGWGVGKSATSSKRNSLEGHDDFPPDFQPRDITPKVSLSVSRPMSELPATRREMNPRSPSEIWSRQGRVDGYERPESKDSYKESLFDAERSETDDEDRKIDGTSKGFLKQYERQSEESMDSNGFQEVRLGDHDGHNSGEASGAVTPTPTTSAAAPKPIPAADVVAAIETEEPKVTLFRTKIPPPVEASPIRDTFPASSPAPDLPEVAAPAPKPVPAEVSASEPPAPKPFVADPTATLSAPAPAPIPAADLSPPSRAVEASPVVASLPPAPALGPLPVAATQGVPLAEQQAKRFTHTKTTSSAVSAMRARFEQAQQELGKK